MSLQYFQHSIWKRSNLYKSKFLCLQNQMITLDSLLDLLNSEILIYASTIDEHSSLTTLYRKQCSHGQLCVTHPAHKAHADSPHLFHLSKGDLLQSGMNYKIFSSCNKWIDHILVAPIKVILAVNLRNFGSVLMFLFPCHKRKAILLMRRTRCTMRKYHEKWPTPGPNSSRSYIFENKNMLIFLCK